MRNGNARKAFEGRSEDWVWSVVKDKLGVARQAQESKEEVRHTK